MTGREDPLAVAAKFLPGFDRDSMKVDGRWHCLDDIMRMTNREIARHNRRQRERGQPERPQVAHKPEWLYREILPPRYAEGAEPQRNVGFGKYVELTA